MRWESIHEILQFRRKSSGGPLTLALYSFRASQSDFRGYARGSWLSILRPWKRSPRRICRAVDLPLTELAASVDVGRFPTDFPVVIRFQMTTHVLPANALAPLYASSCGTMCAPARKFRCRVASELASCGRG